MPGEVVGLFDGYKLVIKDGSSFEVPQNYAAKTKLVFGDKLRMTEENGKKMFKQVQSEKNQQFQ